MCIYGAGVPQAGVANPDPYNPADWVVLPSYNKLGKVSERTSWDSFSYAIQMGHNVYAHVNAVQRANIEYDKGITPSMLVQEKFDRVYFKDVVNEIFATSDKGKAEKLIDDHNKFWLSVIGTRGATGKKTVNASTMFNSLFDDTETEEHHVDDSGFDEDNLDKLESDIK